MLPEPEVKNPEFAQHYFLIPTKNLYLPVVGEVLSQLQLTLGGVFTGVVFTSLNPFSDSVIDVFIARTSLRI